MTLYISNLPLDTTTDELHTWFCEHGKIDRITLLKDRFTGKPKGCAFVEFRDREDAERAIAALHDSFVGRRKLAVREANARKPRPAPRDGRLAAAGDRDE